MKLITTFLSMFILTISSYAEDSGLEHCKKHLLAILSFDLEDLNTTYAENVNLMPGHEFTKPEHKLGDEDSRKTGLTVTRDKLLQAMKADIGDRESRPKDAVKKKLSALEYVILSNKAGKFAAVPSDPVGTADGKLHFELKKGDLLYKIKPPRGDFLLLHLRKIESKWVVISEYLD